ncbi:ATP-binding cassette domain-containing protein [Salipiger sp. P9]|uniref:ATP-binding cassette domain-containing protein n=1 Tax=Salipiger pentaromativorans TaxID=2943193 RepID=UPI00215777C3|nr:ATP-binding cassette domain-containing protein [Salipiger pentaromativorans]MCR8549244.1 ATP-binding cassette domain-containing protein [Salipiger pentaromativorans]
MLEVRGLTIRAGDTVLVEELSLDLETGRLTCLIGPSGYGKSSVIKRLSGVLAPELRRAKGQARLEETELSLPHEAIAYQPQQDTLFPWLTILENAALGLGFEPITGIPSVAGLCFTSGNGGEHGPF